jgi:hypothetical protein
MYSRSRYGHCPQHIKRAYAAHKREQRRKGREAQLREKQLVADMRALRGKLETPAEEAENEMYARIQEAKKVIAESLAREADAQAD